MTGAPPYTAPNHTPYYPNSTTPPSSATASLIPQSSSSSSALPISRSSSSSSVLTNSTLPSGSESPATAVLPNPAVVEPTRKRNRTSLPQGTARERELLELSKLSDPELGKKDDTEILEVIEFRLRAPCYTHYDKTIVRHGAGNALVLSLRLDCKYGEAGHKPQIRPRSKLKDGTSNFRISADRCDGRRGKRPSASSAVPEYNEARHRAIVAVRCSARKRSFRSVEDPEHLEELRLVSQNPHIKLPSQETVRADVERLYEGLAPLLTAYFQITRLTRLA